MKKMLQNSISITFGFAWMLQGCSKHPVSQQTGSNPGPDVHSHAETNDQNSAPASDAPNPFKGLDQADPLLNRLSSETRAIAADLHARSMEASYSPRALAIWAMALRDRCVAEGSQAGFDGDLAYRRLVATLWVAQNSRLDTANIGRFAQQIELINAPNEADIGASLQSLRARYDSNARQTAYARKTLVGGTDIVDKLLKQASVGVAASGAGLPAAMTMGAVSWGMRKSMDAAINVFDENAALTARDFLSNGLKQLGPDALNQIERLKSLPPEEASKQAGALVSQWSNALVGDGLDPQTQMTFNGFVTRAALQELAQQGSLQRLAQENTDQQLSQNRDQLIGLSKTFLGYAKESTRQLKEVREAQEDLQQGLGEINERVGVLGSRMQSLDSSVKEIAHDVGFMKEFMFGQMSPQEQVNALRNGLFPNMLQSDRDTLMQKISLVEKRERLNQKIDAYLDGAQTFIQLGQKLGVNAQTLQVAQTVVSKASAGHQLFSSLTSGNYLGAAHAVLGLFGIGGPDVAAQRHEQIMGKLGEIAQGQQSLLQGQADLFAGQKQILLSQTTIYNAVTDLAYRFTASHEAIQAKLGAIHDDVLFNRELMQRMLVVDTYRCPGFLSTRPDFDQKFDRQALKFSSYGALTAHFTNNVLEFMDCERGLELALGNSLYASTSLNLKTYDNQPNSALRTFLNYTYAPTLAFLQKQAHDSQISLDALFSSLQYPIAQARYLSETTHELIESYSAGPLQKNMTDVIAVDPLIEYANEALEISPYYELVDWSGRRLLALTEAVTPEPRIGHRKAASLLKSAMDWVNAAIAQQNMIAGQLALEKLYQNFDNAVGEPGDCPDAELSAPRCLLKNNQILAANFMLYAMRRDVTEKKYSAKAYVMALGLRGEDTMLRMVTSKPWRFHWETEEAFEPSGKLKYPKGWSASVGGRWLALPSGLDFVHDELLYAPQMSRLLEVKAKLVDALTALNFQQDLSPAERAQFTRLVMESI